MKTMTQIRKKKFRILAISPAVRGVGFAVLDADGTLADWGVKLIKGNKNAASLAKIEKLIAENEPDLLVLEDALARGSFRSPRVRKLFKSVTSMAKGRGISVKAYSRGKYLSILLSEEEHTKQDAAEFVAKRFPDQLATQLPPKRKPWQTENYQMAMFVAVALAVAAQMKKFGKGTR
jgi:RNase H-fold protein (predicted Holliday junction resolvase)